MRRSSRKNFNTHHTQIRLKPEVMLEELTNALDAMDTPSGDGINTYVVSKAIHKEGIRVALSGVGGDELFAGYPIFANYIRLQQKNWIWKLPMFHEKHGRWIFGQGRKKRQDAAVAGLHSPAIENSLSYISDNYYLRLL